MTRAALKCFWIGYDIYVAKSESRARRMFKERHHETPKQAGCEMARIPDDEVIEILDGPDGEIVGRYTPEQLAKRYGETVFYGD